MEQKYKDIVHLAHPVSKRHPPMPRQHRAAQFAPFAALVGHDAAVAETARLTERRVELDEGELAVLDCRFRWLKEHAQEQPPVTITYFRQDTKKDGGAYLTVTGAMQWVTTDILCVAGERIPLGDIVAIDCEESKSI